MTGKKVQLYTDRAKTIEASPETSAKYVTLSDGNDLQKVLDNDLTTPTVVHEETSFKVGVGDIDVSSSVVDGEVGRMVIKGKTYQNILPEPSTPVLTNNKEMFKVNEGLDPNVEVIDGIGKSAILKGNTLVNIFDKVLPTEPKNYVEFKLSNGTKANTTYTFFIDADVTSSDYSCGFLNANGGANGWASSSKDARSFTRTTNTESSALKFMAHGSDNTILIKKLMIIEGDYTNQDISFFTGMQSVKMPVLTTVGKNLWNDNDWSKGLTSSTGVVQTGGTYDGFRYNNELISVNGLDKIYCRTFTELDGVSGYSYRVAEYDSSKTFLRMIMVSSQYHTLSNDCEYVRVHFDLRYNPNQTVPTDDIPTYGVVATEPITTYEPYKTNILRTPEEVVLKGVGNVKDTLNCNTREYVKRIGEVVLNGSSNVVYESNHGAFYVQVKTLAKLNDYSSSIISDKGRVLKDHTYVRSYDSDDFAISGYKDGGNNYPNDNWIYFAKKDITSASDMKAWLTQNPITIQYELATPIIKTVDLSTSGNWEKVVLDGSQALSQYNTSGTGITYYGLSISDIVPFSQGGKAFANTILTPTNNIGGTKYGIAPANSLNILCFSLDGVMNKEDACTYLSQNPIAVWYQTQTHKDSTQVKQPIFFKDGHIQLSSGADNSLIPTLDYQAKTSNSYVMDLMKTNTRYTMKAKSASGTFTIDGTSYGAGTNGTFTTPTSMTNKLLVMSNKTNTEVMILEGDVVSKTIPYFKGIKSAFEDESKIEVLSTGKNMINLNSIMQGNDADKTGWENKITDSGVISKRLIQDGGRFACAIKVYVKPSTTYTLSFEHYKNETLTDQTPTYIYHNSGLWGNILAQTNNTNLTFTTKPETEYIVISVNYGSNIPIGEVWETKNIQLQESATVTEYESHKSNNTKIPLLSPLRSLPNGVCDELIIDRMKKKATLIQRVGYTELNGDNSEQWGVDVQKNSRCGFVTRKQYNQKVAGGQNAIVAEHLLAIDDTGRKYDLDYTITMGNIPTYPFVITIPSHIINERGDSFTTIDNAVSKFKRWLSKAPISVVYQLATPIVTEIDLENFPLIYKDGHIFLNSEIAPVVEIDYNVNQSQQIQANNETLQRHELDILDLDNLIVSFVNAEYNLRLLKFDMEMSMMALAE